MDCTPGWYGKLPALGDFASRRLPDAFVARWDTWLQSGLTSARAQLGEQWLQTYLTSHVWHFVLTPGVIDEQYWAGVLLPSVDRVGRYFPLTLCAAFSVMRFSGGAALIGWMAELEEAARSALDANTGVEFFDARVLACQPPEANQVTAQADSLSQALLRRAPLAPFKVANDIGLEELLRESLASVAMDAIRERSLWWCAEQEDGLGGFLCAGLPEATLYARMLAYSPDTV